MASQANVCALCKEPAALKCSRCHNAPAYLGTDSEPTWYCSSVCQKLDWSTHKSKCNLLKDRKILERAAGILKEIMYKIRLHASPLRFKSIHGSGSRMTLKGVKFPPDGRQPCFFPEDLEDKTIPAEAVVVHSACTEALIYLYGIIVELLRGMCPILRALSWGHTNGSNRDSHAYRRNCHPRHQQEARDH